jgi:hypothetical protein
MKLLAIIFSFGGGAALNPAHKTNKGKNELSVVCFICFMLVTLSLSSFTKADSCGKLEDGRYRVKFNKAGYRAFEYILSIDGENFIEYKNGKEVRGKIIENGDCTLRLDYLIKTDSLNNIQKTLLNSGQAYFEFENTRGRKIKFRLTGYAGPHTTAGEGQFVKIK